MTLVKGYDTTLGHEQKFCDMFSISNMVLRSNGRDVDFGNACTVTLEM